MPQSTFTSSTMHREHTNVTLLLGGGEGFNYNLVGSFNYENINKNN